MTRHISCFHFGEWCQGRVLRRTCLPRMLITVDGQSDPSKKLELGQ